MKKIMFMGLLVFGLSGCASRMYRLCGMNTQTGRTACGAPASIVDVNIEAKIIRSMDDENVLFLWIQKSKHPQPPTHRMIEQ